MPPNERVGINVQATFRADTSQAKQAFDEFARSSTQAAQRMQGSLSERDSSSMRAKQLLREQLGENFSYIAQQKEINKILHEQRQHYRELSDTLYRQERAVKSLGGEEEKEAMKRIRRLRDDKREMSSLVHALESHKAVGLASEGMASRGAGGILGGMTMSGAVNGGIIAAGAGALGRAAMANPITAGIVATLGGLHFLDKFTSAESRYSEDIDVALANVGRRTGGGLNLRSSFEPNSHGRISDTFKNLGFTGEDIAGMMQAFGMPGSAASSVSAIKAQAQFARAFGFGESPDMIAGLGRRATQLGAAEPSQQPQFWAMMTVAVEKGLKNGVDASETMRSLLGMTEQVAAHTGVVSRDYVAGLAGIQSSLSAGPSRLFKGERGAQEISSLMQAFQNPQSIAQERFMMNSIMGHFGGVPTAQTLGLSGGEAAAYSQMTQIQQLQYVMQQLPSLMQSNPKLMGSLVQGLANGAGAGMQSMITQAVIPGMTTSKLGSFHASLFDTLRSRGMDKQRLQEMGTMELLGEVLTNAPEQGRKILEGHAPNVQLTDVERARTLDKMNLEDWSAKFSMGSMGMRLGIKGFKSGVAETFENAADRISGAFGSDGFIGKAAKEAFTADEDAKQANRIKEMERQLMYAPGNGSIYKQSYGGERMTVDPIQVTGSIQLISSDGGEAGQLPATAISLLIQKAIQDQSGSPRASSPGRTRLLAPRI